MNALMEYIPTQGQGGPPQDGQGARKYQGEVAQGYDEKREQSPKWQVEQKVITGLLDDLPAGSWVLDAPCGTGRFFRYYQGRGFVVRGIDISADMINLAAQKLTQEDKTSQIDGHGQFMFAQTDVCRTGMPDKSVDAAVCCRITRWIEPVVCQQMFTEMQRVARDRIILTARVANHPQARPIKLFTEVLQEGWALDRDEPGADENYRILCFKRVV